MTAEATHEGPKFSANQTVFHHSCFLVTSQFGALHKTVDPDSDTQLAHCSCQSIVNQRLPLYQQFAALSNEHLLFWTVLQLISATGFLYQFASYVDKAANTQLYIQHNNHFIAFTVLAESGP